jgi:hypothetical protein
MAQRYELLTAEARQLERATAGSCRERDIYRTRKYGLLQVSTGFHRQYMCRIYNAVSRFTLQVPSDTGICYTAKLSENFRGPHYRFSRFRNVFQVLGHLQVRLIITGISRKNENHRIRLDKEYGK